MAVNESGNLGDALREGLTDGAISKTAPDRGGVVEGDVNVRGMGQHSASVMKDEAADRLHDGQFFGEADQDTIYSWTKTDDVGRDVAYPSIPG